MTDLPPPSGGAPPPPPPPDPETTLAAPPTPAPADDASAEPAPAPVPAPEPPPTVNTVPTDINPGFPVVVDWRINAQNEHGQLAESRVFIGPAYRNDTAPAVSGGGETCALNQTFTSSQFQVYGTNTADYIDPASGELYSGVWIAP